MEGEISVWASLELADILRHGVARKTWRWQDRRNMRLVCKLWRESVLLPQLFLNCISDSNELDLSQSDLFDTSIGRTSFVRAHRQLGPLATLRLGPALTNNRTVTRLSLEGSQWSPVALTKEFMVALGAAVERNKTLTRIDVFGFAFADGADVFFRSLETNRHLRKLSLSFTQMTDQCASTFARSLQNSDPTLRRTLKLTNAFSPACDASGHFNTACPALPSIVNAACLACLDLRELSVGAADLPAFSAALFGAKHLKKINLSQFCASRYQGQFDFLIQLLEKAPCEILVLDFIGFRSRHAKRMTNALCNNRTIKALKLRNNWLEGDAIEEMTRIFTVGQTIEKLYLSGNRIEDDGLRAVAEMLKESANLKYVTLSKDGMSHGEPERLLGNYVAAKRVAYVQAPSRWNTQDIEYE